jgi:hypothetical protein
VRSVLAWMESKVCELVSLSNVIPESVNPIHNILKPVSWLEFNGMDNLSRTKIVVFLWVAESSIVSCYAQQSMI